MKTKICTKCKKEKPLTPEYFPRCSAAKDGFKSLCKECVSDYWKNKYYKKNSEKLKKKHKEDYDKEPEKHKQRSISWNNRNKEYIAEYNAQWNEENTEHISEYNKKYREENPGIGNHNNALRRARILQATPAWANLEAIKKVYEEARLKTIESGIVYHVDHIYPLKSDIVCGLHVSENLQIITRSENCHKRNKVEQCD